jgi:hypothetical protein
VLAAMLMGGEVKLRISGREVTTPGAQAIDALKTNKSFGAIGVSLRDNRPSNEMLALAATRLTQLVGEAVIPLEQEISKAAAKHFSKCQHDYASLTEKLLSFDLAGADRAGTLAQEIADVLYTDASDAPQKLGAPSSTLFENLTWASQLHRALNNGLDVTLRELQRHRREIEALPDTGLPGELRREASEDLAELREKLRQEDFYKHAADLNSMLTQLQSKVSATATGFVEQQRRRIHEGIEDLQRLPEWQELPQSERANAMSKLDELELKSTPDLDGLKRLLARDFDINSTLEDLKRSIQRLGQERLRQRIEEARVQAGEKGPAKLCRSIAISSPVTTGAQIDELLRQLNEVRTQLALYAEIEVTFTLGSAQEP